MGKARIAALLAGDFAHMGGNFTTRQGIADIGFGEFLTIVGTFQVDTRVASVAALGVILAACYALFLYRRVIFGELEKETLKNIMDLNRREVLTLAPLVVTTIFFGVYPAPIMDVTAVSVENLIAGYEEALETFTAAGGTTGFTNLAGLLGVRLCGKTQASGKYQAGECSPENTVRFWCKCHFNSMERPNHRSFCKWARPN